MHEHRGLMWVLGLSLAATAGLAVLLRPYPEILDSYGLLARSILEGRGLSYGPGLGPSVTRAPVYPSWLALEFLITGGNNLALRLLEWGLVAGASVVVYRTALLYMDKAPATWAAAFVALHPLFLYYAAKTVSETLSVLLFAIVGWTVLTALCDPGWRKAALVGLAGGLALLTKSSFLVLLLAFAVLAVWGRPRQLAGAVRDSAVAFALALVVVAPWLVRNHRVSGTFVPMQTMVWYNFWFDVEYDDAEAAGLLTRPEGFNPAMFEELGADFRGHPYSLTAAEDAAQEKALQRRALEWVAADPVRFVRKIARSAVDFWIRVSSPLKMLVVAVFQAGVLGFFTVGSVALWRRAERHPVLWGLVLSLGMMFLMSLARGQYRYSLVLIPALALPVGVGVHTVVARLASSGHHQRP